MKIGAAEGGPAKNAQSAAIKNKRNRENAMTRWAFVSLLALGCALLNPAPATSDDFFKGKQITMMTGSNPGGVNEAYARLLGRHMTKHIPGNPTIIFQSVPGAGGAVLANRLAEKSPRDGTAIGQVQRTLLLDPLLLDKDFAFNPIEFNWLGSLNRETNVLIVSGDSKVKSIEDAKNAEAVLAAGGADTEGVIYPMLVNDFLGTKFKVVSGYPGDAGMMLAIERREVEGRGGVPWSAIKASSAQKLADGKIKVILQMALNPNPELSGVPSLLDLVKNDVHRQVLELLFARSEMGRPFVLPPGVPPERVAVLRKAFIDTTKDPEFLAEAKKLDFEIDVMDGEAMQKLMQQLYGKPKAVYDEAKRAIKAAVEKR
jgi:tripartite-type tricarboxylate transporter receptor subunit TctC